MARPSPCEACLGPVAVALRGARGSCLRLPAMEPSSLAPPTKPSCRSSTASEPQELYEEAMADELLKPAPPSLSRTRSVAPSPRSGSRRSVPAVPGLPRAGSRSPSPLLLVAMASRRPARAPARSEWASERAAHVGCPSGSPAPRPTNAPSQPNSCNARRPSRKPRRSSFDWAEAHG